MNGLSCWWTRHKMFLCESMQKYLKGNTFIVSPVVAQKRRFFIHNFRAGGRFLIFGVAEVKVAHWKKRLRICCHHTANLNFLFISLFVFLYTNGPFSSQVTGSQLSQRFAVRNSVSLPCKNKSPTLSYSVGKFKFVVCWDHINKRFFHQAPLFKRIGHI